MIRFGVILLIAQAFGNPVGDQDEALNTTVVPYAARSGNTLCSHDGRGERDDYRFTPSIGYHKFHTRAQTWDGARKTCMHEGAYLAIITSTAEALVMRDMIETAINNGECTSSVSFVGLHDYYKVGEWITVSGEPLACTGYDHWVSHGPGGSCHTCGNTVGTNERCGGFNGQALLGLDCTEPRPFFCKMSLHP